MSKSTNYLQIKLINKWWSKSCINWSCCCCWEWCFLLHSFVATFYALRALVSLLFHESILTDALLLILWSNELSSWAGSPSKARKSKSGSSASQSLPVTGVASNLPSVGIASTNVGSLSNNNSTFGGQFNQGSNNSLGNNTDHHNATSAFPNANNSSNSLLSQAAGNHHESKTVSSNPQSSTSKPAAQVKKQPPAPSLPNAPAAVNSGHHPVKNSTLPSGLSGFQTLPQTPFGSNSSSSSMKSTSQVKQDSKPPAPASHLSPSPPALISPSQKTAYQMSRHEEYNSNGQLRHWCALLIFMILLNDAASPADRKAVGSNAPMTAASKKQGVCLSIEARSSFSNWILDETGDSRWLQR